MAASASQIRSSPHQESSNDAGQQEYTITNLEQVLIEGYFPRIPTGQIYKQSMLSRINFLNGYKIKTLKQSLSTEEKQEDIILLSKDAIRRYQKKYCFLHIGLVQVLLFPLTMKLEDTAVSICLRDARRANLKDSILVAFETSVTIDGPQFFNWYPDYSLSLSGLTNFESLLLTVQPHKYNMLKGRKPLAVEYKMCYKLMKANLEPQYLIEGPKLELNTQLSNILVPTTNGNQVILQGKMIGTSQIR